MVARLCPGRHVLSFDAPLVRRVLERTRRARIQRDTSTACRPRSSRAAAPFRSAIPAPDSPFGLDLSSVSASRANLVNVVSSELATTMRVQPGNAVDSYLYMKVVDDPRILGDRMPAGTPNPLGAGDLALIRTWIEDGAP